MWDSDTILVPPACTPGIDVTGLSGFALTSTSTTYSLNSLYLCKASNLVEYTFPYEFDGIWTNSMPAVNVSPLLSITQFLFTPANPVSGKFFNPNPPQPLSPGSFPSYSLYWPNPPVLEATADAYGAAELIITDTWTTPPPGPVWHGSVIRITITPVAGPVTPTPGGPVEALLGLTNLAGGLIGQPQRVSVSPGQAASVDFDSSTIVQGFPGHVNVVPTVSVGDPLAPPLRITVEVFDKLTGFGGVLATTDETAPPPSQLAPQGLADGQVMRLIATAGSPNPCIATLSFADANGAPIGTSAQVNLSPGQSQPLDLSAATLGLRFGQRTEVQPMVQIPAAVPGAPIPASVPGAAPVTSICSVSTEVFDVITGRTWTYQQAFVQ